MLWCRLTNHGLSLNVSDSNTAATLGVKVDSTNIDGQGNFVVAGNCSRDHKAATLQLSINNRHTVAFEFLVKTRIKMECVRESKHKKNDSVVDDIGTYRSTADAREARSTWLAANLAVQAAKAKLSRAASAEVGSRHRR